MRKLALVGLIAMCCSLAGETPQSTHMSVANEDLFDSFSDTVRPLLEEYCIDCHGAQRPKGKIDLQGIDGDLVRGKDISTWIKISDQLSLGLMPKEKADQPSTTERQFLIDWIRTELAKGGRATVSKLVVPGYGNYVSHDLLFGDEDFGASFSPARIWRIRPEVYDIGIQKLAKGEYVTPFNMKAGGHGFKDYDNQYQLAGPDLSQLMANTKKLAAALTATQEQTGPNGDIQTRHGQYTPEELFDTVYPTGKRPSDEELTSAIDWIYQRVLLRAPRLEEVDRLLSSSRESIEVDGPLLGVRNMLSSVLLSAESLYRSERGSGPVDEHGRQMLGPRELMYAIAYALTNDAPDEELQRAVAEGRLGTREEVEHQVERMLHDAEIPKPRILNFFREYFEYHLATDVFKDKELFRYHNARSLVEDTDHLVLYIYEQDENVLEELLTTNKTFVQYFLIGFDVGRRNAHGAKQGSVIRSANSSHTSYSLAPDWKWTTAQPIKMSPRVRAGILTQPSWLVAKSGNFDNHAIWRGLWIRYKLLGGTVPDVPITVDAQLPIDKTLTLREKMGVTEEAYCWQCHSQTNPLGLPFERYDHFGRWRTQDHDRPVVTTGALSDTGDDALDGDIADPIELVQKLAGSTLVRQVFVRHAFRYWMGRNELLTDAATLRRADKAYVDSGGSMKAMIVSLLTSDTFLYRKNPVGN